jgi:hypothetical protein
MEKEKSRRDDTLLTVGFSLRTGQDAHLSAQSPAGTALWSREVSSLRDLVETCRAASPLRRLKPTVNKGLSLRDSYELTISLFVLQGQYSINRRFQPTDKTQGATPNFVLQGQYFINRRFQSTGNQYTL